MTVLIVDMLEVVDIEEGDGEIETFPPGSRNFDIETFLEGAAISQTGEAVRN